MTGSTTVKDIKGDYLVMLARVRASNRGATPSEVQANVMLFETDYPTTPRHQQRYTRWVYLSGPIVCSQGN